MIITVLGKVRGRKEKEWLSADTDKLIEEGRNLKSSKRASAEATKHYNYLCREIKELSRFYNDAYCPLCYSASC